MPVIRNDYHSPLVNSGGGSSFCSNQGSEEGCGWDTSCRERLESGCFTMFLIGVGGGAIN